MNPAAIVRNPQQRVIAVFTDDSQDLPDVRRVRSRLRKLGFTDKMAYKTNEATRRRAYAEPEDLTVHVLFE